ncbi:hypothetical protein ACFHYQ_26880 [Sphaerimonospora cavernae]|uniref:Uncharacterized protein n=1 Tax=Sphaerimonospora cavernae TaxID=1740611 RepID=A0ABV6UCK6_9ACTN
MTAYTLDAIPPLRLPIRVPGKVGKAYRSGANLTLGAPTGSDTWERFLTDRTTGA